jgi:signal transduction histidine kinase
VLARLLGQEIGRERAALELDHTLEALELAERRRVELAEELRHELRAPLQVIDGYAEAMLDGVVERDDEHVVLVRREAGRAMRLLDDLAELTRLESRPGSDDSPGRVSVDEVALEMRERLAPLAESAGIELTAEVAPAIVAASRRRIEQLVVNLVRNALRATQHGGGSQITVFVRPAGDTVSIGVEDDGPGIPVAELAHVFDRFYRGVSARDQGSGSGLGLTIVHRIVTDAGGTIAAEPVAPNGTRIVAQLPLAGGKARTGGEEPTLQAR